MLYNSAQCVFHIMKATKLSSLWISLGRHFARSPFKSRNSVGAAATCAACAWNLIVSPISSHRLQPEILTKTIGKKSHDGMSDGLSRE